MHVSAMPQASSTVSSETPNRPVAARKRRTTGSVHCSPALTSARSGVRSQVRAGSAVASASATRPNPKLGDQLCCARYSCSRSSQRSGSASTSAVGTCTLSQPSTTGPKWYMTTPATWSSGSQFTNTSPVSIRLTCRAARA
ncbi:hypothetical protein GCM10009634_68500 [Saccharothrix xinjiangensis]